MRKRQAREKLGFFNLIKIFLQGAIFSPPEIIVNFSSFKKMFIINSKPSIAFVSLTTEKKLKIY